MRQKRGALRLLLGAWLGATGGTAAAAVDTPDRNPWQATGLDFSFIEQHVQTDACYTSEIRFLSCLSALQQLLERDSHHVRMAFTDDVRADAAAVVRARFGTLVLFEAPSLSGAAHLSVADEVRARAGRLAAWRKLYRTRTGNDIDFSRLREWLLSGTAQAEYDSADAAAAINAYLSIEDAHARIMPAELIEAEGSAAAPGSGKSAGNRYSGIGVGLELIGTMPVITELIPGGPAARAGLRQHDMLLSVDAVPFDGGSLEDTLNRLRGLEGTAVELAFKRGSTLHSVRVVRERIALQNVVSSVVAGSRSDWGYLRVHSFLSPDTCVDVEHELDTLTAAAVSGLILDVRNNAGGRIDQAVCVADLFLDANLVVLEMRSTAEHHRSQTMRTRFETRTRLPVVTLVNAGTGSASEVLAGALRDHGRSLLIGERTFGKGTIQTPRPWGRSGAIMKFTTVARYYLPSGSGVQRVGIEPDFHVPQQPYSDPGQQLVLRLEDLYPTTPPSAAARPVSRTAPQQLSLTCLSGGAGEGQPRAANSGWDGLADYPLYRAGELLGCML